MDEPVTDHVYNHSQFENLRKFWGLGANLKDKDSKGNNTSTNKQDSVAFSSQKSKEFDSMKSPREKTQEGEKGKHLRQGSLMAAEEVKKLNSNFTLQVPPDEIICPKKPPRKFTYHLLGNEPSQENVERGVWNVLLLQ